MAPHILLLLGGHTKAAGRETKAAGRETKAAGRGGS